jgi:hypothetical protein
VGPKFPAVGQDDRIFELAGPFRSANGASPSCRIGVNPDGIRGASPSLAVLQAGQGAPGAPQRQALSPSQDRSRWRSHFMCIATGEGESPRERAAEIHQRP